jgi:hypothetical protein
MKALITELQKVNPSTVFGAYILMGLEFGQGEQVVRELRDQLRDAGPELENAIGTKAIELLKNIAA